MIMKHHVLAALREEYDNWEELLGGLDETQITTPLEPSNWSIKDDIAHLMAWQQRSIARVEAALLDREPKFPTWKAGLDPEVEGNIDGINAWIYESHRDQPLSQVYQDWSAGFQRFLQLAEQISERDLLDSDWYSWLDGYPLVLYLIASYDHHQEHLEKLQTWLREHGIKNNSG